MVNLIGQSRHQLCEIEHRRNNLMYLLMSRCTVLMAQIIPKIAMSRVSFKEIIILIELDQEIILIIEQTFYLRYLQNVDCVALVRCLINILLFCLSST